MDASTSFDCCRIAAQLPLCSNTIMHLNLTCACGSMALLARDLSPERCSRVICHCAGCRAWAARTEPALLDEYGGTERILVDPASVEIRSGSKHLGCAKQTRTGAHRWFAACCNSSLGLSTNSLRVPFLALDVRRARATKHELLDTVGPLRARFNGHFPRTVRHELKADWRSLARALASLVPLVATWWWRDSQRESPFVDGTTLRPAVSIKQLQPANTRLLGVAGCR